MKAEKTLIEKLVEAERRGYQSGIKEVVEWIEKHQLIKPDGNSITQFHPFYQIEERELKDRGSMSNSALHKQKRLSRAKMKAKINNINRPKRKPATKRSTYHENKVGERR